MPREIRTDESLVPLIRGTSSISEQPKTVCKSQDSKTKADLKHNTLENPNQLFWAKRLEGLRATDVNGIELGPNGIKLVGPNVNETTSLQLVVTSLHVTVQAVTGQKASKRRLKSNPGAFLNPQQSLIRAVYIKDADIRRQEDRVKVACREALKR